VTHALLQCLLLLHAPPYDVSCVLQLLRLRGALTSRGELALAAIAKRHSPALLAAIEEYGANQVTQHRFGCTVAKCFTSILVCVTVISVCCNALLQCSQQQLMLLLPYALSHALSHALWHYTRTLQVTEQNYRACVLCMLLLTGS
jgi:hypothetical protein